MRIEEELFSGYLIEETRLIGYGFQPEGGRLCYVKTLPGENLEIILEYTGTITGRIMDLAMGEEYTGFRIENASGFPAEIRRQFADLLLDIREKCCRNQFFRSEQARRINDYIFETYHDVPDFLWPSIPTYGAYRQGKDRKWYAIIGSVPLKKVDKAASSAREVEVINVKADKTRVGELLSRQGYYPAYHMNKKSWVSVILDDTLPDEEIQDLIRGSYESL